MYILQGNTTVELTDGHICMYIYGYVCLCVCVRICVYVYTARQNYCRAGGWAYMYINICIDVCLCVCACIYIYVNIARQQYCRAA